MLGGRLWDRMGNFFWLVGSRILRVVELKISPNGV